MTSDNEISPLNKRCITVAISDKAVYMTALRQKWRDGKGGSGRSGRGGKKMDQCTVIRL